MVDRTVNAEVDIAIVSRSIDNRPCTVDVITGARSSNVRSSNVDNGEVAASRGTTACEGKVSMEVVVEVNTVVVVATDRQCYCFIAVSTRTCIIDGEVRVEHGSCCPQITVD